MPLTPEWAIFFSAELAALATLTGLVVVAISINLPRILSYAHLPTRVGEALIGPVGAIIVTSLVLIPEQAPMLLGAEVILVSLVIVVAPIVFQPAPGTLERTPGGEGCGRSAPPASPWRSLSEVRSYSRAPDRASSGSPRATVLASSRSS
jgi:hypothetical protein